MRIDVYCFELWRAHNYNSPFIIIQLSNFRTISHTHLSLPNFIRNVHSTTCVDHIPIACYKLEGIWQTNDKYIIYICSGGKYINPQNKRVYY